MNVHTAQQLLEVAQQSYWAMEDRIADGESVSTGSVRRHDAEIEAALRRLSEVCRYATH